MSPNYITKNSNYQHVKSGHGWLGEVVSTIMIWLEKFGILEKQSLGRGGSLREVILAHEGLNVSIKIEIKNMWVHRDIGLNLRRPSWREIRDILDDIPQQQVLWNLDPQTLGQTWEQNLHTHNVVLLPERHKNPKTRGSAFKPKWNFD